MGLHGSGIEVSDKGRVRRDGSRWLRGSVRGYGIRKLAA